MRKWILVVVGLVFWVAGLVGLAPSPVAGYPSMGSNCALCHPGGAPGGSKPAPAPQKKTTAPQKQTAGAKQTGAVALSCKQCHPRATAPIAGMKCEACHEGGAAHAKAPTKTKPRISQQPVKIMLAYEISVGSGGHIRLTKQGAEVCAACHAHAHSND